jgi:serine/threonine protein kinase
MTQVTGTTGPEGARDDYEVVELVTSEGGQGHLFRARLRSARLGATLDGADVSLKQFRTGAVGADRVREVAEVVGARRHPHLGRQIETFHGPAPSPDGEGDDDADLLYVASVWVPGEPLDVAFGREGTTVAGLLTWVRQVGSALDYIHAEVHDDGALVHRDVKPSNVIVTPAGNAVLIDPGLARVAAAGATGTPWGSPGYLPPETIDPAGGSPASDRWQLAATLVAVLLGTPPGSRPDERDLRARLVARLSGEVAAPEDVADGILAMLATEPTARPVSAADWAADLAARAGTGGPGPEARSRGRRHVVAAVAAAVLVVAALGIAVVALSGDDSDGDDDAAATDAGSDEDRDAADPPDRVTAVVDNRVTDGPAMREDTPAYLSTVTENFCRPNGCEVPATELVSGDEVVLVCHTLGQRTTNGDDTNTNDDANPELVDTRLWYYVVLERGGEGFLSEVWIAEEFRGGLDLPLC